MPATRTTAALRGRWIAAVGAALGAGAAALALTVALASPAQAQSLPVPIGNPPTADFRIKCTDLDCQFTDRSTDSDGRITRRDWDFGDGTGSSDINPAHSYVTAGTYTIELTVTDNLFNTSSATATITVSDPLPENEPPRARFGHECLNVSCTFENRSSDPDGQVVAMLWRFGGDGTSVNPNPFHQFSDSGQYPVTLEVTDDDGSTASVTKQLTVSEQDPREQTVAIKNRKAKKGRSADRGEWKFFKIRIPRHQEFLQVRLSGCGKRCPANLDLYMRRGKHPNLRVFECADRGGGSNELCRVKRPSRGSWKIGVLTKRGEAGAKFKLRAKHR